MSFSDDIKRFTTKAEKAALFVFRGTSLDIFSKIILRSPIDTGRFRGNWQAMLNVVPGGVTDIEDKSGQGTISKAAGTVSAANITDSIYLINNLPYAESLENGSSTQAPTGMVKTTVAEFKAIVDKNARQNR